MKFVLTILALALAAPLHAQTCADLPNAEQVKEALTNARREANGGFNLEMWASTVDRSGIVCAVVHTGAAVGDQWPGSRVISAQKANTANAFSLPGLALSTANLFAAVQPGGSLFGLQESNPVDTEVAYEGKASAFGTKKDPMVGERIGGVNVFGGGLALYNSQGKLLGAIGVSGDSSCADHNIAWRARHNLKLDFVPAGVSSDKNDNIIFDIAANGKSKGGFGHTKCGGSEHDLVKTLPKNSKKS